MAVQVSVGAADESGRRPVAVHSRPQDTETDWVRHAVGSLSQDAVVSSERLETAWPPPGAQRVEGEEVYDRLAGLGYGYGPVFQGLRAMWRVGEELFAEVRLPAEADVFGVHPALLDAALHPLPSEDLWVPFSWSGVRLHSVGASVLRVRLTPQAGGAVRVAAFDGAGLPVVTVDELRLQPLSRERLAQSGAAAADPLYEVRWTEAAAVEHSAGGEADVRVEHIEPGGDVRVRVGEVLTLVQGFVGEAEASEAPLVVVTRGDVTTGTPDPATAAVWGLLRSAQAEHPGRVIVVDVPADETDAGSAVASALASGEAQVALRDGRVFVPRLVSVAPQSPDRLELAPGGTVLISGAGGALGGLVARHLVAEYGVRHLLLLGRRGGEGAGELVDELAGAGASVTFA
ncbi:polyketide synthase dehydratase domain-containing protein, partial [Streptomyces sp. NPDC006654]|uniref:polyketide synthase dehydratase domain-containing protein n=1 Tax=Streptomyces sp. NPDC006654 TaxID=3156897 RepID=UPI0033DA9BCB